jgi:hypothetical protein
MAPKHLRRLSVFVCVFILAISRCSGFSSLLTSSPSRGEKERGDISAFPTSSHPTRSCTILYSSSFPETKGSYTWVNRVHQLVEYRKKHGSTLVPKRYPENPSLGNWVNKQRVLYRRYCANETPCSLTAEKVEILNQIGFCWDGTLPKNEAASRDIERKWWLRLKEFQEAQESSSKNIVSASLDRWMRQQRAEYQKFQNGDKTCKLDKKKVALLSGIDPNWWKTIRRRQWEERCRDLIAYRDEHGDCCVPINYKKNKKLANWVSNCRKKYNLRMAGEESNLSLERIEELNEIGMVWDRWDFEFRKNGQY